MKIRYEDETHSYFIDSMQVMSVTQILADNGLYKSNEFQPQSRKEVNMRFGSAVHKATELMDNDDLVMETLHPSLKPYLEAWRRFKGDCKVTVLEIEKVVASQKYLFAGRIDRIVRIGRQKGLLDIKSGMVAPVTAIQTAGYEIAHDEGRNHRSELIKFRLAVQLLPDGTYKVKKYEDPTDKTVFLSCLTIANWRKSHAGGNSQLL